MFPIRFFLNRQIDYNFVKVANELWPWLGGIVKPSTQQLVAKKHALNTRKCKPTWGRSKAKTLIVIYVPIIWLTGQSMLNLDACQPTFSNFFNFLNVNSSLQKNTFAKNSSFLALAVAEISLLQF